MCSKYIRLIIILAFVSPLACADNPHSEKRIRMRRESFQGLSHSLEKRENDGHRRLEEARQTLDKWWRMDCERFNEIAPTVGDYLW